MTTKTMKSKVDIQELMLQACKEMRCAGITMGFAVAQGYLKRIAERAIELDDKQLLEELEGLYLINHS